MARQSRALRKRKRKIAWKQLTLSFASEQKEPRAFWQRRFYDFDVWSENKLREKLNYMRRNPLERKLVLHPKDWPWSSWTHYVKGEKGLIAIDSLETVETQKKTRTFPKPNPKGAAPASPRLM